MKHRIGVWGGSMMNPYIGMDDEGYPADTYPQMKQLAPTTAGFVPIIIKPDVLAITPVVMGGSASELVAALVA